MSQKQRIELTIEGLEKLKSELRHLVHVKREENLEALKEARSHGDLSENADYDAARNENSQIEGRIKELEYIIKNAKIIKPTDEDIVEIGKRVKILFIEKNEERVYTIVSSIESNPLENKISIDSALVRAIKGATTDEEIKVQTDVGKVYHVKILEFINDENL